MELLALFIIRDLDGVPEDSVFQEYLPYGGAHYHALKADHIYGVWKLTGNFNHNISASQLKDMAMERKAKHKKAMVERLNCMDARISTLKPNQRKSFYNFLLTLD